MQNIKVHLFYFKVIEFGIVVVVVVVVVVPCYDAYIQGSRETKSCIFVELSLTFQ